MGRCKKEKIPGFCPVCKGEDLCLYRKAGKRTGNLKYSVTEPAYGTSDKLVQCERCRIVSIHPFPSEEVLKALYEEMEDTVYLEEEETRRQEALRGLFLIEKYAPRGRLLDVGCFSGLFLDVARKRGWEVVGVEPSAWARKIAQERFSLQVVQGALRDAKFSDSSFDVVAFIDTLEHLRDPKGTLMEARRILKEGGVLYLTTPDIDSAMSRLLGDVWWGLRQEHIVYFSKKSLSSLLKVTGFQILSQRSFQHTFRIGGAVRRLKGISPFLYRMADPLVRFFRLARGSFKVTFFDQIELVAKKGRG